MPKVRFEEYECRSVGLPVFEVTLSTFTFPDRGQLDKYEVVQVTLALMNRLNPSFRLAKCSKFVEV